MSTGGSRDLQYLLGLDEEELLAELGASQIGETLGVRPSDFGRYLRLGRVWMDTHTDELRRALCSHPKVASARTAAARDEAAEVATVADILLSMYGQVPATIVAVLVLRRGFDKLCGPLGASGTNGSRTGE
ncbi:MAG: hypothetical protein WCF36_03590 [Candidatus Nanopelagicales bacterium]